MCGVIEHRDRPAARRLRYPILIGGTPPADRPIDPRGRLTILSSMVSSFATKSGGARETSRLLRGPEDNLARRVER
jgi:hypothetical protein